MKSLNWQHKLLWRAHKLINAFTTKEVAIDPYADTKKEDKSDELLSAINDYKRIYAQFNAGQPIACFQDIKCLTSFSSQDFLFDVIGKIRYIDISNLRFKIIIDPTQSLAWKIYTYILKPSNVIKLFEEAVQHNKITMNLDELGYFSCNQTLYADNKVFLRFKGKHRSFWLIQHFSFYSLYFPEERIYFSLKNHSNHRKHQKCMGNFHLTLFQLFDQLVHWDDSDLSPTFAGLLLSYRRPFHYFADMLPTADLLLSSSLIVKQNLKCFITLTGRCFFKPQRFFGAQYESLNLNAEQLNAYLIANCAFIMQPVKNIATDLNNLTISKSFYQKTLQCSDESGKQDQELQNLLNLSQNCSPLLWFGACDERRSWIEGTEAICKIAKNLKHIYPNLGLIIDGLTAPEDISRDQFLRGPAHKECELFEKIAVALPGITVINAIALKSYQKIVLASRVDFFLTCFLTDSLYVAQFNSKPGLAYGTTSADVSGHRHPMTVLLPKKHITDVPIIDAHGKEMGVSYSIDPNKMVLIASKVFEYYQQLNTKEHDQNLWSQSLITVEKKPETHSIIMTSLSTATIDLCISDQSNLPKRLCDASAYPIFETKTYLFRFESYVKNKSLMYVYAYAQGKQVFKSLSFEAGRARYITFPAHATAFRLFIHLTAQDSIEFFDIHWNTDEKVGSLRLGGYLDLTPDDEKKRALKECHELYDRFNAGQSIAPEDNTLRYLKYLNTEDFIEEIVGAIENTNARDLNAKSKMSRPEKIAMQLYAYISESKNVIGMYEQAVLKNKVTLPLGEMGLFSCDQSLLIEHKLFLRFKGADNTFWIVQHFSLYGIYFPAERLYISLKSHQNIKHKTFMNIFHALLFSRLDKMMQWDSKAQSSKFAGLLLACPRPYHYFLDTLSSADALLAHSSIVSQHLKTFITLTGESFFSPNRLFGSQYESLEFKDEGEFNDHLLHTSTFTMQPVKDVDKHLNYFNIKKSYYQKLIQQASEITDQNTGLQNILTQVKHATPLIWLGVCDENRAWIENSAAICKIAQHFNALHPTAAFIIDGLTTPEGISNKQFKQGVARNEVAMFTQIEKQLPGFNLINAIGLKSDEKMALASQIDFFITCFLTDSIYVAQFHSKPGLGYGPNAVVPLRHRHPMTVIFPRIKVTDLPSINPDPLSHIGLRYSINPESLSHAALKVFEYYQQLACIEENYNHLFSGEGYLLAKDVEKNSIFITNQKTSSISISVEPYFISEKSSSCLAYLVLGLAPYLFRFEAFSNRGSVLYIYAYANEENIFSCRLEAGRSKQITFPAQATHFRFFIHLAVHDELEFFDIHWNTHETVGSLRLGGYLDLQ